FAKRKCKHRGRAQSRSGAMEALAVNIPAMSPTWPPRDRSRHRNAALSELSILPVRWPFGADVAGCFQAIERPLAQMARPASPDFVLPAREWRNVVDPCQNLARL